MLGSDTESDADIVEPILRAMGEQIFRTGNLGSGHALKALNNYVAASGFATAAEALVLAGKCGLEAKTFVDVLNSSSGRNFSTETTLRSAVLTESFDTGFSLGLMTKDVAMAVELANELGQDAEIGKVVFQRLQAATQHLGSHVDHSEAIKYWSGEPSSLLGRESKC
jgi:3-hydroxyisobutyrate dehydrogenase